MSLHDLNALDAPAALRELERCCGSRRWAAAMAGSRPFADEAELLRVAEECWWGLGGADWLEAFSHHPRIGDRAAGWAADEQAGVSDASDDTARRLTALNREYERKFGHVFLIFATGKQAGTMLEELHRRLANDPATELRNAATEQSKITALRLRKLLASSLEPPRTR